MERKRVNLANLIEVYKSKGVIAFMVISALMLLVSAGMNLAMPLLSGKIIDSYFSTGMYDRVLMTIIIVLSGTFLITSFFRNYCLSLAGEKMGQRFRDMIYAKIGEHEHEFYLKQTTSKLLTVLISDVNFVKEVFSMPLGFLLYAVFMIIGSIYLMLSLNVKLGLMIIIVVPLVMVSLMFIVRNIRKLFLESQKQRDNFNKIIDENVKAAMLVRVFTSEDTEKKKFAQANSRTLDIQVKIIRKFAIILPTVFFTNNISTALILYVGGLGAIQGTMTIGEISAFINYVFMFIMPIMMISMISTTIGQAMASLSRINDVLDSKPRKWPGKNKASSIRSIKTKKLSYSIGKKEILKDIDLEIKSGQKIGIIGLTGSGKSMLVQLLTGLLRPTSGEVQVNKKDIFSYDIDSLRDRIGNVFQDNFLIDDTIDKNIDFMRDLPKEDIELAKDLADVKGFEKEHSPSYTVGEMGRKLSGGQKQRPRIARAIAGRPDILILDDCTSNLDIITEKKIINNVKEKLADTGILIISQKIASFEDCDMIYVMEGGRITDSGKHKKLLEKSILYKEIEMTQKNYKG